MANFFKNFLPSDKTTTRALLHESIPLTGTLASGTYATSGNIKNYSHGMFQSVYDYPYLSSSANHIYDLTLGFHATSSLSASTQDSTRRKDKINIYNQMAQVLMGYDKDGNIERFDSDGNLVDATNKMNEVIFVNFARLLTKDEIKKGSVSIEFGVAQSHTASAVMQERIKLTDSSGSDGYFVNGAIGQYGTLFCTNTAGTPMTGTLDGLDTPLSGHVRGGLIFYQAGIAAITASVFSSVLSSSAFMSAPSGTIDVVMTGSSISGACDDIRHRIYNIQYNNTTELNSTIYFCRLNNGEFNYSSNPTYTSGSRIVVKNDATDIPVSYLTSVGLYSADNELLAVAKVSEPLRKDPATELTLRVRLDY